MLACYWYAIWWDQAGCEFELAFFSAHTHTHTRARAHIHIKRILFCWHNLCSSQFMVTLPVLTLLHFFMPTFSYSTWNFSWTQHNKELIYSANTDTQNVQMHKEITMFPNSNHNPEFPFFFFSLKSPQTTLACFKFHMRMKIKSK